MNANSVSISALMLFCAAIQATEIKVSSPDGKAVITVTDSGGLNYTVTFDGREVVAKSRFGIIADNVDLGRGRQAGQDFLAQDQRVLCHVWRSLGGKK